MLVISWPSPFFEAKVQVAVVSAMKGVLNKAQVDQVIEEMGFTEDARTEQLDVPTLLRLTELVRKRAPDWTMS